MTQTADTPAPPRQALWRDFDRCYRAVASRDARFDGQFITAVRTTGIYCRPSCPAMTPLARNVEFFATSAAAQAAGFRACRRCLPDAVPGSPEWNVRADLASRAMRLIADGVVEREGVPGLANRLNYSERQLGRVLAAELGAGPLALARAHRAHTARLLIERSALPFGDIAFAAGFSSVRQFNETVRGVFAVTPSQLRGTAIRRDTDTPVDPATVDSGVSKSLRLSLRLPFRRPFDAAGVLTFLSARAIDGVETLTADGYARTLRLPLGVGVARLRPADDHIQCSLRLSEVGDLSSAVARVRRLLDLDADPAAVDDALASDPLLAPSVAHAPGIRVPGAADAHELVIRAMFGQQVTVAAARTAAGKLVAALGEPLPGHADDDPVMLFPTAKAIAEHGAEVLRGPEQRIRAITGVAGALASGELDVHIGRDPDELRVELIAQPGIGRWTADYVLMRVLGAPDVLLNGDVALRNGAAAIGLPRDPAGLAHRMQALRPWRSYAGMHLWRHASSSRTKGKS